MRFIRYILMPIIMMWLMAIIMSSCGQKTWSQRGIKMGWVKNSTVDKDTIIKGVNSDTSFVQRGNDTVTIHQGKIIEKYYYNTKTNTVTVSAREPPDTIVVQKNITTVSTTNKSWLDKIEDRLFNWVLIIAGGFILVRFSGTILNIIEKKII